VILEVLFVFFQWLFELILEELILEFALKVLEDI